MVNLEALTPADREKIEFENYERLMRGIYDNSNLLISPDYDMRTQEKPEEVEEETK